MDSVTTHTMGIQRRGIEILEGGTKKYYETLALKDETYEKTRVNQEKKRKELEEFVARNKARASTAALAQSKQKQLDKMEDMEKLESANNLSFNFTYKETPSKLALSVEDLGFGYKKDEKLFKNLSFTMEKGDCLAIIGKNGKGKSTLLNYIAGELEHQEGKITTHPSTAMSHFGQTNIERLHVQNTIEDEITSVVKSMSIAKVRSICGTMMFGGELADKKISVLSGGERSRVMLGKIIATPSNLLLLDEPTNHLDMQSIESLSKAIKTFQGSTIMVTHSEMLLRKLATKLVIFHKGTAEFFDGTYDDFLEKIGWEEDEVSPKKAKPKKSKKERKEQRTKLLQERNILLSPLKKELKIYEIKVEKLENELEILQKDLNDASSKNDNSKVIEISTNISNVENKLDIDFEQLSTISEQVDKISDEYKLKIDEV
jgi:ATP-binding cassette subfamily F protein 3